MAPQFHAARPTDLRAARPWHRLAHVVARLPAELEALARTVPLAAGATVLDLGCADVPYRHLFPQAGTWLAADLLGNPHATLTLRSDGTVPVDDGTVDLVLSTQVLEHVEDPALYLRECARVLRPGGRLLLSTHGLMVYHPDPDDFWRWTAAGLRRAIGDAGLVVERERGIVGLAASGLQLVQDAWYWRLPRPLRPLFALVVQGLARAADALEPQSTRDLNPMVLAVVACRP